MIPDPWQGEALRLYRRYQFEIVEACGLCPWAEPARLHDKVREKVLVQQDGESFEPSLEAITAWAADPTVEVGLLIYPRVKLGRRPFEDFVTALRNTDAARYEVGRIPFAMAAFHPDADANMTEAERLIPFLRRTPDPTLQLVRGSVLERVRSGTPQGTQFMDVQSLGALVLPTEPAAIPLRERIARTNLATTERMGLPELTRRLDDICRDREETYRALEAATVPEEGTAGL